MAKIKDYCDKSYCLNYRFIEWDGGFIDKWLCDEHKEVKDEQQH